MKKYNSLLTGKFYKVKNPVNKFLCALCKAPRTMMYQKNLTLMKYAQILVISMSLTFLLYQYIGAKSMFSVFIVWSLFEFTNKLLYRKDIPCPHCGFDATWYRRDVKLAHKKVTDYWQNNYPDLVNPTIEELEAVSESILNDSSH